MSSFKGAEAVEELNEERSKSGVRLSTLNPQVREKLIKFDTSNDGELSLEEAIQGLVALQKQSNNYKRMLYLIVPLMTIMLACVLGVNILAIQLTKDMITKETTTNIPILSNKNGGVLHTAPFSLSDDFFNLIFNEENINLSYLQSFNIDNSLSLPIISSHISSQNGTKTFYALTPAITFSVSNNGEYEIEYNPGFSSNNYASKVYSLVENELMTFGTTVNMDFITKAGVPRARGQFGCGIIPAKCR